ncbi:prostate androgen-regulated mucin-like protein 1 [Microcaecilia unicolor]|uniref:Prostate androgen-regulated mucin-like protein 1 n=1 Tax=Microcaecilia unicolor TaxID=1415580 RepID=A0A6P7WZF0_9AMPH|nr:prostate androgen-regulated mucin-like protein 1 [Microcaecilia unicolor]
MLAPVLFISLLVLLPGLSAGSTNESTIAGATGEGTTVYMSRSASPRNSDPTTYSTTSTAIAITAKTEVMTPSTDLPSAGTSGKTSSGSVPSSSKKEFSAVSTNPTTGTVGSSILTSSPLDVTTSNLITSSRESSTSTDITSVALVPSIGSPKPTPFTSSVPASSPNGTEGSRSSSVTASTVGVTSLSSIAGNANNFSTHIPGTASTTAGFSVTESITENSVHTITNSPEETSSVTKTSREATKDVSSAKSMTDSQGTNLKESSKGLSPGAIAAITIVVIAFVLLVFGGAAYLKIRHSSYGRLLDDNDYGSWGNYNNPLYDDS